MSVELIEHNPSIKKPAMLMLQVCKREGMDTRGDVEAAVADEWQNAWRQSPSNIMEMLVRAGALEENITVNGEPYDGTLEDIQLDLSISEDAEVVAGIRVMELGDQILTDYAPSQTIENLFQEKPAYSDVFKVALEACQDSKGCSLPDLEAALMTMPQLQPDPQTHQTKVYSQFFIDALETAGAIEWDGAWHITSAGEQVLAA